MTTNTIPYMNTYSYKYTYKSFIKTVSITARTLPEANKEFKRLKPLVPTINIIRIMYNRGLSIICLFLCLL